ncbi:ceramidase [Crenobacter luteus]|uniref:ceramidase domain-containing protein n=1 Tax=Crenobacter luteus TaxID=1452487 RepID=UPI0010454E9A|nr:ceramidase domain-containing protein [Crenobacter luteus]TCP12471.1 ceramidase [Crenobacter luteus]
MSDVDLYCERLAAGLWAEPVNTLSDLAFLAAAVWLWRRADAAGAWRARGRVLAGLAALIGAGSFVFHLTGAGWAEWLDVLPILLFQLTFIAAYARGVAGWPRVAVAAALLVFVAAGVVASGFPAWLNGSLGYLPALAVLAAMFAAERDAGRAGARDLGAAAALFVVSLALRSVDNAWCAAWPLGTHFAWHGLNAVVLARAGAGLLASGRAASGGGSILGYGKT